MTDRFEPTQFGRYQLVERIAIGGMAEIFKATASGAHGFEKVVAIKRILPNLAVDREFVEMFITEAKVMVKLNHPKVVQVLDFGEVDGHYYIAMEYVQGVDGLALLRTCARLRCRPTTAIAVHVVAEILDGLDYAHGLKDASGSPLGIVHRDISPSNIFISNLGEVKLGDFGIARAAIRRRQTETGALKGKYGYMAPEVVSGDSVDHRADLFSVGVVLAELLMIRRLFIAKSDLEVLLQVRDARLDRLDKYGSHISADLRRILEHGLARDPASRYQDAASFRDALHRFLFDQKRMIRGTDVRHFLDRLREMGADGEEGTPTAKWSPGLEGEATPSHGEAAGFRSGLARTPSIDAKAPTEARAKLPSGSAHSAVQAGTGRVSKPTPETTPTVSPSRSTPPPIPTPTPTPAPRPSPSALEPAVTAETLLPKKPPSPERSDGLPDPSALSASIRRTPQEGTEYSAHTRERISVKSSTAWKVPEDLLEAERSRARRASSGAGLKVPPELREEAARARKPAGTKEDEPITREAEVPSELLEGGRERRDASVGLTIPRELIEPGPRGPGLRDLLDETGPQRALDAVDLGREPSLEDLAARAIAPERGVVGKKRRIPLGPPPKTEPVPVGLPDTGEAPRVDPVPVDELERESSSSGMDFPSAESGSPRPELVPPVQPAPAPALAREPALVASTATREAPPKSTPDLQGHLARHSLIKVLFRLAVAEETGLLVLGWEQHTKEIYLVDGDPQFVTSNLPEELFGQYLVQKGVIAEGELSMALAMLPHFEGKLGNALVALKLLKPVQVLRHLTNQVRQKLLNAFEWSEGTFSFYQGVRCEQESAPLGLNAFEVIGAGVMGLSPLTVEERLRPLLDRAPRSASPPPVPPEVFGIGPRARQAFDCLDGRVTVSDQLQRFDDQEQRDGWGRMIYLLVEAGLAKA
jgi:serine/threonine protein kinase